MGGQVGRRRVRDGGGHAGVPVGGGGIAHEGVHEVVGARGRPLLGHLGLLKDEAAGQKRVRERYRLAAGGELGVLLQGRHVKGRAARELGGGLQLGGFGGGPRLEVHVGRRRRRGRERQGERKGQHESRSAEAGEGRLATCQDASRPRHAALREQRPGTAGAFDAGAAPVRRGAGEGILATGRSVRHRCPFERFPLVPRLAPELESKLKERANLHAHHHGSSVTEPLPRTRARKPNCFAGRGISSISWIRRGRAPRSGPSRPACAP